MDDAQIHKIANFKSSMSLTQLEARYEKLEKLNVLNMKVSPSSRLYKLDYKSERIFIPLLDDLFQFAMEGMKTAFSIKNNPGLPRSSMYVLIRSSIEASSHANWLMSMDNDKEAIYESLRTYRETIVNCRKIFEENAQLHGNMKKEEQPYRSYLEERMNKIYPKRKPWKRVQYSKIVRNNDVGYAKDIGRRGFYSGLAAWELCSAVTHGNQAVLSAVAGEPGERALQLQTNDSESQNDRLAVLVFACMPAIENLEYSIYLRGKYSSN